ncbi:MAG: nucleotidyltransferase domain-containing protein [Nitrospinota bacterium]|nr:MAG: nucleotidyltransferase domain-containing protein [Nitrospinota bacterium]
MKTSLQQGDRQSLRSLVDALRHGLQENLWGVVLFGSATRGEAGAESDLDLLLVADGLPEKFTIRMQYLRQMVPGEMRSMVSFIAKTRAEFEGSFPSYYLDIGVDGIILYDREGYMRQKLIRIQELIRLAGLHRRRFDHGFIWEWGKPPTGPWRIDWSGVYMDSEQADEKEEQ